MNALNEPLIQLWNMAEIEKGPYCLNTGSRSIKTNIPDPDYDGVSRISVTSSKVVIALGNVIRVYSFDL